MMTQKDTSRQEDVLGWLLVTALDGQATPAQIEQLNDLLRTDEQSIRSAALFLVDDVLLAEEIGTIEEAIVFLTHPFDDPAAEVPSPAGAGTAVRARNALSGHRTPSSAKRSLVISIRDRMRSAIHAVNHHGLAVLAATLFIGLAFGWHYWSMMSKFDRLYTLAAVPDAAQLKSLRTGARENATLPGTAAVARVTGQVDCKWPGGELPLKFGDQLAPGQRFRMSHGLLQLTYESGAKIVVEGPADFTASTATEAELSQGKMAAAVPRFARGYTIVTPTSEVVDLGTEFGVAVDDSGTSEVHVFKGDVVARQRNNGQPEIEYIHAHQDEAVHFDGKSPEPLRITADRKKFIRSLIPDPKPEQLPSLPVTKHLALWLAADVMAPLGEGEPVSIWRDILVGGNNFADDAWQFDERLCPAWIHDGKGRPAVRFDGWSTYLATNPMATGDRQTAFVVFASSPASFASQTHGGMLLKYGVDAPSLEFALFPDHTTRARVWASNSDGSNSNVGVLQSSPVEPLKPCAVAYSYDAEQNLAELLVNGRSEGVTTAPKRLEQHAKKYIGSHSQPWWEAYFLGNIYEIIIYDTALDASDRDRVFKYLSSRYGFSLGE